MLDLMGAGCQPCQFEMLELKKVSENYSHNDVAIVSIDVWIAMGETATHIQQLIAAFNDQLGIELDWTFGLDDTKGTLFNTYTQGGVPTIHILDREGNIYYSNYGYTAYSEIKEKIDELL